MNSIILDRSKFISLLLGGLMGVAGSVYFMKSAMASGITPLMIYPLIFISSWAIFGYLISSKFSGMLKYSGLIVTALVISSMMVYLPYPRAQCIVDDPGMPMFVIAWVLYSILSSIQ